MRTQAVECYVFEENDIDIASQVRDYCEIVPCSACIFFNAEKKCIFRDMITPLAKISTMQAGEAVKKK